MNRAGVLEDVRGELEGLRDAADPGSAFFLRMDRLVHDVDETLADLRLAPGVGCSLCAAGHVPLGGLCVDAVPLPGMGPPDLLNGLQS